MRKTFVDFRLIRYGPYHAGCSRPHQEDDQIEQLVNIFHCPLLLFGAWRERNRAVRRSMKWHGPTGALRPFIYINRRTRITIRRKKGLFYHEERKTDVTLSHCERAYMTRSWFTLHTKICLIAVSIQVQKILARYCESECDCGVNVSVDIGM